ncbi:MAG: hypothetical protein HZC42_09675 [Candidatus Eisenbacteria bacterium]|nr:hypothetical protein [Candidatus Eisenbacteria bacterium]
MPDWSYESVRVLVTLLPGFLSLKIKDFFLPPLRSSPFEQSLGIVAFAVANYVITATATKLVLVPGWLSLPELGAAPPAGPSALLQHLYALSIFSLGTGLVAGLIVGHDLHYRLARGLRLTNRTGRQDVWQDTFAEYTGNWLVVHLADERRIVGWAQFFSDHGGRPSLFLRQASWVEDDGTMSAVGGEGLLVCQSAEVKYVEFRGTEGGLDEAA